MNAFGGALQFCDHLIETMGQVEELPGGVDSEKQADRAEVHE
jgi:hypothetical protein